MPVYEGLIKLDDNSSVVTGEIQMPPPSSASQSPSTSAWPASNTASVGTEKPTARGKEMEAMGNLITIRM